jgi:alanine dehydrogenase
VYVLNRSVDALTEVERLLPYVSTEIATPDAVAAAVALADLLIGAVLVSGAQAPRVVRESMVQRMRRGAVIVDVAIDQGGCIETIPTTSHSEPVYMAHGVVHYAAPDMPGTVPVTSTLALTSATLPYIQKLAGLGVDQALVDVPEFVEALNVRNGKITHPSVAEVFGG